MASHNRLSDRSQSRDLSPPLAESAIANNACIFISAKNKLAYCISTPSLAWMIYLFSPTKCSKKAGQSQVSFPTVAELEDIRKRDDVSELTLALRELASATQSCELVRQVLQHAFAFPQRNGDVAVCIPHFSYACVADLLVRYETPPPIVSEDWRYQLESRFPNHGSELDPVETFVAQDGLLIPIHEVLKSWSQRLDLASVEYDDALSLDSSTHRIAWPWIDGEPHTLADDKQAEKIAQRLAIPFDHSVVSSRVAKRASRRPSKKSAMLGIAAALGVLLMTTWMFWPIHREPSQAIASKDPSDLKSPVQDESLETDQAPIELTTLDVLADTTNNASMSDEVTAESLLAQLNASSEHQFSLSTNALDSLISDAMISSVKTDVTTGDGIPPQTEPSASVPLSDASLNEPESASESKGLTTDSPSAMRSIRLASASHRERITTAPNIAASQCQCDIKIDVHAQLVIEPNDVVAWKGATSGMWRVALEDEEPELLLEIQSKPGSRWQLLIGVALKESATSPPIPMGPKDAVAVSNRLLEYHRWLSNSIPLLQNAKLHRTSRSRIDYVGEIKRVERQLREVEKAIERWKTIEKLAILFFSNHDIQVTLTAPSKN
jgi:hypothetical protein